MEPPEVVDDDGGGEVLRSADFRRGLFFYLYGLLTCLNQAGRAAKVTRRAKGEKGVYVSKVLLRTLTATKYSHICRYLKIT